jgi:uncharacterized coiled-coil protein SlyX
VDILDNSTGIPGGFGTGTMEGYAENVSNNPYQCIMRQVTIDEDEEEEETAVAAGSGSSFVADSVLLPVLLAEDRVISAIMAGGTKLLRRDTTMKAVIAICNAKTNEGAGLHLHYKNIYPDLPSLPMCRKIFANKELNKELCVEDVHAAILARIAKKNYDTVEDLASEMSSKNSRLVIADIVCCFRNTNTKRKKNPVPKTPAPPPAPVHTHPSLEQQGVTPSSSAPVVPASLFELQEQVIDGLRAVIADHQRHEQKARIEQQLTAIVEMIQALRQQLPRSSGATRSCRGR